MPIDLIDILFVVMAAFGFYFGYTFGLMKVVLFVISLSVAVFTAMAFTPMVSRLIIDTFQVNSAFLPFIAFFLTLLVVLLLAGIVAKIIEEAVDNKRFNSISKIIGGMVMGLIFTLLYCVLITFFGQAGVISLVFNEDAFITKSDNPVILNIPSKTIGEPDTLIMNIKGVDTIYKFIGTLNFGSDSKGNNKFQAYVGGRDSEFLLMPEDTISFSSKSQISVYIGNKKDLFCFCDSSYLVSARNDTINFNCTDHILSSRSTSSLLYKYIEVVPQRGTQLMQGLVPSIDRFIEFMTVALKQLEEKRFVDSPAH